MDIIYELLLNSGYDYSQIIYHKDGLSLEIGNNYLIIEPDSNIVRIENLNGQEIFNQDYQENSEILTIIEDFKRHQEEQEKQEKEKSKNQNNQKNQNLEVSLEEEIEEEIEKVIPSLPEPKYQEKFKIYTYGKRNYDPTSIEPKITLTFDLSRYHSAVPQNFGSLRDYFGTNLEIQKMVVTSPMFLPTLKRIIKEIEINHPQGIAIFCNHGKHRSVAMAEIIKKYFYRRAQPKHLCIEAYYYKSKPKAK